MSTIKMTSLLGGGETVVESQEFEGGRLQSFMGGCQADLRNARLKDGEATIKARTLFGGVKIIVPKDWAVTMQVTSLLGGASDKRSENAPAADGQTLTVKGFAIFGGVEVAN